MVKGLVLLIVGIVALIAVYSLRPPSGFGETLMMMGQGREHYLKEPVYLGLMAISGVISMLGFVLIVKGINKS